MGFLAFSALAALTSLSRFRTPLIGDAPQYLYVGDTLLHGGAPYSDAAFNKGPLMSVLFAGIDAVSGTSPTLVRLSAIPFLALTALALAGWIGRYAGRDAGVLAGVTFALLCTLPSFEDLEPNTEHYGLPFIFGSLWLATRRGNAAAAGTGALVAGAGLINPSFLFVAPFAAAELWHSSDPPERARRFGAAALGLAVPVAVALAALAAAGALDDMLVQIGGQASAVAGGGGNSLIPPSNRLPRLDVPTNGLWLSAFIGCGLAARDRAQRWPAALLALFIVGWALRVKLPTYAFPHYYLIALPAICGGMALGIAALWSERALERIALAAMVLAVPVCTLVLVPQLSHVRKSPKSLSKLPEAVEAYPVTAFLKSHTSESDRVLVSGYHDEVYWLADRRAPTRFFDVFGLNADRSYLGERRADLDAHPPAAVIVMDRADLARDGDLRDFIADEHYTPAYDARGARVLLRPGVAP